jgi:hypothetical protein
MRQPTGTDESQRLRPALDVVVEFFRSRDASLEADAAAVIKRAGCWAPYRHKDQQLITTSLLLFALVESVADKTQNQATQGRELSTFAPSRAGNLDLRSIVAPFLSTFRQASGYDRAKDGYFTTNIRTLPIKPCRSVTGLTPNVESLLDAAHKVEQDLSRSRVSADALAAAFLLAKDGVALGRLDSLNVNREPFRVELERFLSSSGRANAQRPASKLPTPKEVFVVHGHGGGEHAVAGLLQKLGLEPVILHEKANEGRTII